MMPEWGEYLSYAAAERYTGVSRSTLWRMLRRGEIRAVKIGASVRIIRSSLDAHLSSHAWEPGENG
jgi:excisionase family DNA binding protein